MISSEIQPAIEARRRHGTGGRCGRDPGSGGSGRLRPGSCTSPTNIASSYAPARGIPSRAEVDGAGRTGAYCRRRHIARPTVVQTLQGRLTMHTDGNAIAGVLEEIFGREMTGTERVC